MTRTFGWLGAALAVSLGGCYSETQPKMVEVDQYGQATTQAPEQQAYAQSESQGMLQQGTQLLVKLDQPLGDSATVGERFAATLAQPVSDQRGNVVIPVGSKVFGHIGALQAGSEDQPASITLDVDSVAVDGFERPLRARIVGTDPQAPSHGINPSFITANSAEGELGALIGGSLDNRQPVGGNLGASSSATVSLGLADVDHTLPAGTVMAIQLLEPVSIASLKPYRG